MGKGKTAWFVVILFSVILKICPISYDEMHSQHPIYPQENAVVVAIFKQIKCHIELSEIQTQNPGVMVQKIVAKTLNHLNRQMNWEFRSILTIN